MVPEGWQGEVCKRCGRHNVVGYYLADDVWEQIVGGRWSILCLTCLDEESVSAGVDWTPGIELFPVSTAMWAER